jgi:hypothetical protein
VNTRFGVHDTATRLQQTIDTIKSIKARDPNGMVVLIEMAGIELADDQRDILQAHTDMLIDFTHEQFVKDIYKSDNWDIVKNLTEISCFGLALSTIAHYDKFVDIDRYFKVSGRYLLNADFIIADYATAKYKNKIVFSKVRSSQFDPKITGGVTKQFMSRCWSFPAKDIMNVYEMYKAMRETMLLRLSKGGYIDIEHLLYLYSAPFDILEVDKIGVQGLLGPNGIEVKD